MRDASRIVMLTSSYPLYPGDTTAPFIEELAVHVAELGPEVHVILPAHPRLRRGRRERGVFLHPFPYAPGLRPLQVWGYASALAGDVGLRPAAYAAAPLALGAATVALARLARRLRPDLLVAHWVIPNGPPAALVARATRLPLVVSLHGSDVFLATRHAAIGAAARGAFARADAVTACSPDLAARVEPLGADPATTEVIPYGVDAARFRPDAAARATTRAALGLRPAERLVLAGGRLVHKKGLDVALDAFARPGLDGARATARLVLFGDGALREPLERRAASLGLGDRVLFLGRVERDRVPALFAAADLFLLPSVRDFAGNVDGLPNTLLEALASGVPAIASSVAGVPLVVTHDVEGLLVEPGDPEALAGALAALLADPARAARRGAAARARVERELTWPAIAQRFVATYDAAIARQATRGTMGGRR